jgi:hypothetical protein
VVRLHVPVSDRAQPIEPGICPAWVPRRPRLRGCGPSQPGNAKLPRGDRDRAGCPSGRNHRVLDGGRPRPSRPGDVSPPLRRRARSGSKRRGTPTGASPLFSGWERQPILDVVARMATHPGANIPPAEFELIQASLTMLQCTRCRTGGRPKPTRPPDTRAASRHHPSHAADARVGHPPRSGAADRRGVPHALGSEVDDQPVATASAGPTNVTRRPAPRVESTDRRRLTPVCQA